MMNYDLFKKIVTERIKDYLPQSFTFYEVKLQTFYKTNEKMDCMMLVPESSSGNILCPNIYLNERYEDFKVSQDIDEILEEIAWVIVNYSAVIPDDFDFDLEGKMDKIIFNIMNTEKNEDFLSTVPHRQILDFSVMYRVVMQLSRNGMDTIMLTNQLAESLGLTEEDLFQLAKENTKRLLPMKVLTLGEMMKEEPMSDEARDLYLKKCNEPFIVTNESYLQGAAYLSQPDELEWISERLNDSYYAVPSSVNEFFVIPRRSADLDNLRMLLRKDNEETDAKRDILSDNVYYYDKRKKKLEIA